MALGVLNNISAIYAQNNLANTQASLSKTLQQLSSGSRINSGADDAAGLSLANGLQASATALSQSAKNASEGVDFLQVADGALSQVTNLLNRAVTLATEASNGTLNSSQTTAADSEYQKILTEINTINNTSEYNGIATFAANDTYTAANASDKLTIGKDSAGTNAGFLVFKYTDSTGTQQTAYVTDSGNTSTAAAGGTDIGQGVGVKLINLAAGGSTLQQLATALNSQAGSTVASVLKNQLVLTGGASLKESAANGVGLTEALMGASKSVSSLAIGDVSAPATDKFIIADSGGTTLASTLQVKVGSAAAANITFGMLGLAADAGKAVVTSDQLVAAINTAAGSQVASISGHQLILNGATLMTTATGSLSEVSVVDSGNSNNSSVSIFTSDGTLSTSYNNSAADIVKADTTQLMLDGTSLANSKNAQAALAAVNQAITSVAASRGTIGANINTLTAVSNVMTTQSTNTLAAQNDVTATDYAQATSDMSKFQILSQTGIAALSQANQAQQLITKLLQ